MLCFEIIYLQYTENNFAHQTIWKCGNFLDMHQLSKIVSCVLSKLLYILFAYNVLKTQI